MGVLLYMILFLLLPLELSHYWTVSILSMICLSVGLFGFILLGTLYLDICFLLQVCVGSFPLLSVQQDPIGSRVRSLVAGEKALRVGSELVLIPLSVWKGMVTYSSILAWRILWIEETGGLQSMELQRVRHDWVTEHAQIHVTWFRVMEKFPKLQLK